MLLFFAVTAAAAVAVVIVVVVTIVVAVGMCHLGNCSCLVFRVVPVASRAHVHFNHVSFA